MRAEHRCAAVQNSGGSLARGGSERASRKMLGYLVRTFQATSITLLIVFNVLRFV